jgi:hypothetical protein
MNRVYDATASFWYSQFRISLGQKRFEEAEQFYLIFQFWKRRVKLDAMLTEICEAKEKTK